MRIILLLTIIFLFSCTNKKETIANRQGAIQKEMEQIKGLYYKTSDRLENAMKADTSSAKLNQELSFRRKKIGNAYTASKEI